jgi:hypothetical protein
MILHSEMYFLCDDIKAQIAALQNKGVKVDEISEERWGTRTTISLSGGGAIGLYEPKHPLTFGNFGKRKKAAQTGRPRSDRAR